MKQHLIKRIMIYLIKKCYNDIRNATMLLLQYFLASVAVIALSWFIYARFIRQRIFRDIPFTLTELWFYILILIICVHLYIIKKSIKPKQPSEIVLKFISYISLPFLMLDKLLKTNKYTLKYHKTILETIVPSSKEKQIISFVILDLIPRILLSFAFLLDVFYYHSLQRSFSVVFLAIFPLIYLYHKFSMHHAKEISIQYLEVLYTDVIIMEKGWDDPKNHYKCDEEGYITDTPLEIPWKPHPRNKYHELNVSIREYVQILLEKIIDEVTHKYDLYPNDHDGYGKDYYSYEPQPLSHDWRYEKYKKMTSKVELECVDYEILYKEFYNLIPAILNISVHLYNLPNMEKKYFIPHIKIFTYILFLIGWIYILIKSYPTLQGIPFTLEILEILLKYSLENNPFIDP